MGRLRRSRVHKGIKDISKKYRLKRKTKDLDQIQADLLPENKPKLESFEIDPELPGLGQFYCIECTKHFTDATSKLKHIASKVHKRRLRQLKDTAYTQKEAEYAAGVGSGSSFSAESSSLLAITRKNKQASDSSKMIIE
ncbi:hypothetical protein BB561_005056 [Smittium simulii]|uniref:C2H2-type domain-containing protein n=1 Tax=Smittium simulii TaxID=133385 RepID=A0A2T9YCF8_9FUNG|nr:hypothetical protein BB561_005056 [Smittium simulii]